MIMEQTKKSATAFYACCSMQHRIYINIDDKIIKLPVTVTLLQKSCNLKLNDGLPVSMT